MRNKCLIFDLDNTLVSTGAALPYLATKAGREAVVDRIETIPTTLVSEDVRRLYHHYHENKRAVIITNAPEGYAKAVLRKHGFPNDALLLGGAEKPLTDNTQRFLNSVIGLKGEEYLMIEDSAGGIVTANDLGIASVGVTWGYSTEEQLSLGGAQRIVHKPKELEGIVEEFEGGGFKHDRRRLFQGMMRVSGEATKEQGIEKSSGTVQITALGEYHPYSRGNGMDELSGLILDFKAGKDYSWEELQAKANKRYYNGWYVKSGRRIMFSFERFMMRMVDAVEGMAPKGVTLILGAPNSAPEYCYRTDMNHQLAYNVSRILNGRVPKLRYAFGNDRIVKRVLVTRPAHDGGVRSLGEQCRTMGMRELKKNPKEIDNVIIIDDVATSGSQIRAIAEVMRRCGGLRHANFYGLVAGRTAA